MKSDDPSKLQRRRPTWTARFAACALICGIAAAHLRADPPTTTKPADVRSIIAHYLEDAQLTAARVEYEWDRADAFEALADVQRRAGNVAGAKASLEAARKAIVTERTANMRNEGFMNLAEAQLQLGDLPAAKIMIGFAAHEAEAISDIHLRARALPDFALRQYRCGDAAGAQVTLQLTRQTIAQDGPWQRFELSDLAGSLAATGKLDEARAIAEKTDDEFDAARSWKAIANAQVDAGDIPGAIHSLICLPGSERWLGSETGAKIAEVQASAGNVKGAEAALQFIYDDKFWSDALVAIVVAKLKSGNIDGARTSANAISEEAEQVIALSFIASAQMKSGQENAARRTLAEAAKVAASIEPWFGHGSALCALARAQGAVGDRAGAKASFALARQDAGKGDPSDYRDDYLWRLLQSIVESQVQTGDIDGAESTVASMNFGPVDTHRALACRTVAAALTKSGEDARPWIQSLASNPDRTYASIGAAEGLLGK